MFNIRKAERRQAKLRLALIGVSGSGKTLGAIKLALGMGIKPIVIDTEKKSADLFAHVGEYDVLELDEPYTPERYINAIKQCEQAGYGIIIIDSLSHAYAGEGGVLEMHQDATNASKSKNSYTAWREITPWHNKLINAILHSSAHIIATMRVKTAYEVADVNGKKTPIKIGLAPVQREGVEYEFTVVLDIDKESHLYSSTKDRTQLFEGKHGQLTIETGKQLMDWLMCGKTQLEVEQEESDFIRNQLLNAANIEALRDCFKSAKVKYPALETEFLTIAEKRKHELLNGEMH